MTHGHCAERSGSFLYKRKVLHLEGKIVSNFSMPGVNILNAEVWMWGLGTCILNKYSSWFSCLVYWTWRNTALKSRSLTPTQDSPSYGEAVFSLSHQPSSTYPRRLPTTHCQSALSRAIYLALPILDPSRSGRGWQQGLQLADREAQRPTHRHLWRGELWNPSNSETKVVYIIEIVQYHVRVKKLVSNFSDEEGWGRGQR